MSAVASVASVASRPRPAAAIVEHPMLSVVEGSRAADPGEALDALELLVRWAVRARRCADPPASDAVTSAHVASCGAGEST
jgi:hypothetical protein